MAKSNLLLDMDGTLADTLPGIEFAAQWAVREVLPGRSLGGLRQQLGPPIRQVLARALGLHDDDVLDALEKAFRTAYDLGGWRKAALFPGVRETLVALRNQEVRCFVVTNKPMLPAVHLVEMFRLTACFEAIVSPDARTPPFGSKTEMIEYLVSAHALRHEEMLFVGDGRDDARAAAQCNISFAAAAYGYGDAHHQTEAPVYHVLERFVDLLRVPWGSGQQALDPPRGER